MNLNEYLQLVELTAVHPTATLPLGHHPNLVGLLYCAAKLCGEAGEVSEVIGKALRDDKGRFEPERRINLMKEMGDVFWYLIRICSLLDIDPELLLSMNVEKLKNRQKRGKLHGDGDNR